MTPVIEVKQTKAQLQEAIEEAKAQIVEIEGKLAKLKVMPERLDEESEIAFELRKSKLAAKRAADSRGYENALVVIRQRIESLTADKAIASEAERFADLCAQVKEGTAKGKEVADQLQAHTDAIKKLLEDWFDLKEQYQVPFNEFLKVKFGDSPDRQSWQKITGGFAMASPTVAILLPKIECKPDEHFSYCSNKFSLTSEGVPAKRAAQTRKRIL